MPAERTPFAEDTAAHRLAAALGFELVRNRPIDIYDENALAEGGWMITLQAPDYARIRKALQAGEIVQGARWRGVEYALRSIEGSQGPVAGERASSIFLYCQTCERCTRHLLRFENHATNELECTDCHQLIR